MARLRVNTSDEVEKDVIDRLIQLTSLTGKLLFNIRNRKIVNSITNNASPSESVHSLDYSRLTEEEKYILDA